MLVKSLYQLGKILFGCQLDSYESRTEVLVGLLDILDVYEVIGRAYHVMDE